MNRRSLLCLFLSMACLCIASIPQAYAQATELSPAETTRLSKEAILAKLKTAIQSTNPANPADDAMAEYNRRVLLRNDYPPAESFNIKQSLRSGMIAEQFVGGILGILQTSQLPDKTSYTEQDINAFAQRQIRQAETSQISQIIIYDLNKDTKVTLDEIATLLADSQGTRRFPVELPSEQLAFFQNAEIAQITQHMRLDTNKNSILEYSEMYTLPASQLASFGGSNSATLKYYLTLDPNKDGRITMAELRQIANDAFKSVDKDGDLVISAEEYTAMRNAAD